MPNQRSQGPSKGDIALQSASKAADLTSTMLNDLTISKQNQGTSERRISVRRDLSTEVVIRWHFDPSTAVRYQTADMSATGVRLQSATPLLEGMTGALHAVVPSEALNDGNVMVAWSRPSDSSHGYDVGIRFF